MTLAVGWSHGGIEPAAADLWAPFAAGVALEDNEWGESRGQLDVARSRIRVMRLWTRGNPGAGTMGEKAAIWSGAGWYVQILNEPDLNALGPPADVEGFRGGPDEHADYLLAAMGVAGPGHRIALTPMSPGPGQMVLKAWLSGEKTERAIAGCTVMLAHVYGDANRMWADLQPVLDKARTFGKQVIVSECAPAGNNPVEAWGMGELSDFLGRVALDAPEVIAVCPFAPIWPGDPGVDARRMLGTPVETVLRRWQASHVEAGVVGDPGHGETGGHDVTGNDVPVTPSPAGGSSVAELRGIDVSNHQGPSIDWGAVAGSGRSFAFIKASEDPAYRDPHFARNWGECQRVGMVRGAYCFAQPEQATPDQSVALLEQMLNTAGGLQVGDLVALDMEAGTGNLLEWVLDWCFECEGRLGVVPVIYSGHWFMEPHGLETSLLGRYPLWYASYQAEPPPPPAGWDRLAFWQFSASGTVPGVVGDCDEDVFYGSLEDLRRLGKDGAPVFDVEAERAALWGIKDRLAANGWPRFAQAVEAAVTLSKGEH